MLTRIMTGIVMFFLIFLPGTLLSHTFILPLICSLLSTIGVYEIIKCFGLHRKNIILIPSMAIGLCLPFLVRFTFLENGLHAVALLALIYVFFMFSLPVFTNNSILFDEISKCTLLTLYISIGFSSIVLLRDLEKGKYLFYLVFIGAFVTDIFAYFTGMLIGKHKLSPIISPKKTVEGALGGVVACILSFILYAYLLNSFFESQANIVTFAILGLFTSIVSQLGDLFASSIKRSYGIKDYGFIFPGHGGVLDRFDSILAVAPILFLLCYIVK